MRPTRSARAVAPRRRAGNVDSCGAKALAERVAFVIALTAFIPAPAAAQTPGDALDVESMT
jgi:hypothetical protein